MVAELPHACCDSSNLGPKAAHDVAGVFNPSSPNMLPYDIEEADVQSSDSSLERWPESIDHFFFATLQPVSRDNLLPHHFDIERFRSYQHGS